MTQLNLQNKNLSTLSNIQSAQFQNTNILNLDNNQLTSLPSEIGNFINLQQLFVQNNKLTSLPSEIGNLKNLQILNLSGNQLASLPSAIGNLINLRQLMLLNNKLTSLPPEIAKLKNLEILYLTNNEFKEFPKEICQLEILSQLYFNSNCLEKIAKEIEQLKKLTHLNLNDNKLFNIPKEIGELKKLTHLNLNGNKLFNIPKEIGELTELILLDVSDNALGRLPEDITNLIKLNRLLLAGNKLPIPKEADKKPPQELIKYVLKNQPILPTDRAYIFRNFSMDNLVRDYGRRLDQTLKTQGIECRNIVKKEDLDDEITVVFIIIPFDIHDNYRLIDDIIDTCQSRQKRFYIFLHSRSHATGDMMNLGKMDAVMEMRKRLEDEFADHISSYESFEHLTNLITEGIKQHSPLTRVQSLKLINIGHFSDLTLSADNHITCFEGENGTGKTTILRALALGMIGAGHNKIDRDKIKNLLRIKRMDTDGNIEIENGKIEIEYAIDGKKFTNVVELNPADQGRDIEIIEKGDFHILSGKYNLKSLFMGFPQTRGETDAGTSGEYVFRPLTGAHIDDLISLINNRDEQHLQSFSAWIANLDNTANQKEKKAPDKVCEERKIIQKVFEIITTITGHRIRFQTVRQSNPPDIWITTKDSPNGVSLGLISQGFRVIMGWVGYFVQRMAQAHPLSKNFTQENAVVLIDEIDSYLHPKWQAKLLQVLQELFPNTQFITSTHSPLILGSLKNENIRLLEFDGNGNKVKCYQPPFNPYGADANRILRNLMGQGERPIEKIADLLKKYGDLADSGELDQAKQIGKEIRQVIDPNDPELLKTDVVIQAKEFLGA
ncbi:AAA family ATPase [Desulfococcaceae bacterium HSG8]|nr:AAA family ATPase [Desulfococcaceae bacterium HSG8]